MVINAKTINGDERKIINLVFPFDISFRSMRLTRTCFWKSEISKNVPTIGRYINQLNFVFKNLFRWYWSDNL
ncbi:hypothetical protein CJJ23_01530 [Mycoplasmopsis agassizii]|uniref:Uncharacterized protein n=1 Tax=Mycoplasmopsis agassizii TaxID=33922 RepID=A0A269TL12_9BACT|nr:hypothetical protein CJJ23_01530 [Mycoplasmopsis agassizii]